MNRREKNPQLKEYSKILSQQKHISLVMWHLDSWQRLCRMKLQYCCCPMKRWKKSKSSHLDKKITDKGGVPSSGYKEQLIFKHSLIGLEQSGTQILVIKVSIGKTYFSFTILFDVRVCNNWNEIASIIEHLITALESTCMWLKNLQ